MRRIAWTPELVEATAVWTVVVRDIQGDRQQALGWLKSGIRPAAATFVQRCSQDVQLKRTLSAVCRSGLHELLVAWALEEARMRLAEHAVPYFWQHHTQLLKTTALGSDRPAAAPATAQRACVSGLMTAVDRLHAYVQDELQLLQLLESWDVPAAPDAMEVEDVAGGKATDAVLTLLKTLLLAGAPDAQAFHTWMALCWQRLFVDLTRGSAQLREHGEEEDGEDVDDDGNDDEEDDDDNDDEEHDDDNDAMDDDEGGSVADRVTALRQFCTHPRPCFKKR